MYFVHCIICQVHLVTALVLLVNARNWTLNENIDCILLTAYWICLWNGQFSAPADFWNKGVPFSHLGIWELGTILWNPKCQLGQWRAKHDLWCRAGRCPLVDNICIFYYVITKDSRLGAKNININHKSWLLLLTKVDYHCYHWKDLVWCISQQLYYVQIMLLVKNWEFLLPICI